MLRILNSTNLARMNSSTNPKNLKRGREEEVESCVKSKVAKLDNDEDPAENEEESVVSPGPEEGEDFSEDEEEYGIFFEFFPPPSEDDKVYKIASLKEMDEPSGDEYCKAMETLRVVGDLCLAFGMSADRLTSSSGIKFKRDKGYKERPYDIPPELRRLMTMFDRNRFPGKDRNEFTKATDSLAKVKMGWAHQNLALLMNDPEEYHRAFVFLSQADIVNDPAVLAKATRHLLEL